MNNLKMNAFFPYYKSLIIALVFITFISCNKSDASYTITIGVYTQDDLGDYHPTGNQLIFNSTEACQTWSRTAFGDVHSADSHLHYNAATDVDFNNNSASFTWTEYGPELDQAAIEATCAAGNDGVTKTVNDISYFQDKPNVYMKIIDVIENE